MQKEPVRDDAGNPIITKTDSSNPWWGLLEDAVHKAGGKLQKPEIFPASTDARYFRRQGFPAIGFSPMTNTPILLHDHNEVTVIPHIVFNNLLAYSCTYNCLILSQIKPWILSCYIEDFFSWSFVLMIYWESFAWTDFSFIGFHVHLFVCLTMSKRLVHTRIFSYVIHILTDWR